MPKSTLVQDLQVDPLLALTTMTASGCLPCQERQQQQAAAPRRRDPEPVKKFASVEVAEPPPAVQGWSGVIGVEGEMTGDGRLIEKNALRWENLPLPLRYVSSDVGAHDGAQVVGRITSISRAANGEILADGDFDTSSAVGKEALRQVEQGLTNGVSMDLDDVSFEVRIAKELMDDGDGFFPMFLASKPVDDPEDDEEPPEEEVPADSDGHVTIMEMNSDDEIRVTTDGRIRAATIVAIPAFASAQIHLSSEVGAQFADEPVSDKPWGDFTEADYNDDQWFTATALHTNGDSRVKGDNKLPIREPDGTLNRNGVHAATARFNQVDAPAEAKDAAAATLRGAYDAMGEEPPEIIAASAEEEELAALIAAAAPIEPPAAWFNDPKFTGPAPLTVTSQGRIFGHLGTWDTCHISYTQRGQCITPPHSSSGYRHFHYGAVLTEEGAEIAVGHITMDTRHAHRKDTANSAISHYEDTGTVIADVRAGEDAYGVWVVGALRSTATPEQVRALRAAPLSGDWREYGPGNLELVAAMACNVPGFGVPRPSGLVASGRVKSLVAAGMLAPRQVKRPGTEGALSLDDLRYLKRLADRERREEQTLQASGSLPVATELARRVRASTLAMRVHRARPS